jgi:hypothetical protein
VKCPGRPEPTVHMPGSGLGLRSQGVTWRDVQRKGQAAAQRWGALDGLARVHAPSCAGRVASTRGCARRCRRGEVRRPALTPCILPTWRRRAQGHGLSRSSSLLRAATRAARLAGGQARSARWGALVTAVPKARAASPCLLGAAT